MMTPEIPTYPETKLPEMLTLGDPSNSFEIQLADMPPGVQMDMVSPNIIRLSKTNSQTQQSLLLMRFIVNMTYRIGKASGSIQNNLTDAEIDGMTVGIWQWLGTSGLLTMISPPMITEWMATTRMQLTQKVTPA